MKTNQSALSYILLIVLYSISMDTAMIAQNGTGVDTTKAGNTALGTIIHAAVGGASGAVIGHHMNIQAEEMKLAVPEARVERVGEGIVIEFNEKILFGFDKSKLTEMARNSLIKLREVFQKYPDTNIEVQGHTDSKGTLLYNQALSERRASAVIGNLSENDILTSRLTLKGFGETLPRYTNKTKGGGTKNRRVEILVSANKKMIADAGVEAK